MFTLMGWRVVHKAQVRSSNAKVTVADSRSNILGFVCPGHNFCMEFEITWHECLS